MSDNNVNEDQSGGCASMFLWVVLGIGAVLVLTSAPALAAFGAAMSASDANVYANQRNTGGDASNNPAPVIQFTGAWRPEQFNGGPMHLNQSADTATTGRQTNQATTGGGRWVPVPGMQGTQVNLPPGITVQEWNRWSDAERAESACIMFGTCR